MLVFIIPLLFGLLLYFALTRGTNIFLVISMAVSGTMTLGIIVAMVLGAIYDIEKKIERWRQHRSIPRKV